MALIIFNGAYQQYPGYSAQSLGLDGTWRTPAAKSTQPQVYQISTLGISSVLLHPDINVVYESNQTGVNGVLTYMTFTPSGSILGNSISVEEVVGSFAYYNELLAAVNQFRVAEQSYLNNGIDITDIDYAVGVQVNGFLYGKESIYTAVTNLNQEASVVGYGDLASDIRAIAAVADKWNSPIYYLNTGSGWQQTSELSANWFGVALQSVNGADATWLVNGGAGSVSVSGFTAVGRWVNDPGIYWGTGYFTIENADTGGWLDIASLGVTAAHNQIYTGATLLSYLRPTNQQTAIQYDFWNTGSNGGQFLLSGVPLNSNTDDYISQAQLSQLTYHVGSGADTLWVRTYDGTKWSAWSSALTVTGPIDPGPTVTISKSSQSVSHGQVLNASSFIAGYSAPFGDAAAYYDFWNAGTGGGYFQLANSILPPFAAGHDTIIAASQLAGLQYRSGSGTDTLWVRANDGTAWGPWSPAFTVTAPINHTPQISASDISPAKNLTSLSAASMFTVTDGDGDALSYQLWDSTSGAGSGAWLVNGVVQGKNVAINVTASQLAQTTFKLPTTGSDDLWVRANDGYGWTTWKEFHVSAPVNHAPVSQATDFIASHVQTLPATALFGTYDADNDGIVAYQLWDSSAESSSGHWIVGGVTQGTNVTINITAAQLASTSFKVGFTSDDLWVRAFDGTAWGNWKEFHSLPVADALPVITASSANASHGQNLAATVLFSVSDADQDAITQYQFWDSTPDALSGHFVVGGVAQPSNTAIDVTSAKLASVSFQSGSGSDDLWVRAYDGFAWSAWKEFYVNAPIDRVPVVAATDRMLAKNSVASASSLFSVTDADNDAITAYHFWDSTADVFSGHFAIGGVAQGTNQNINVSAAQLSQTTFLTGIVGDDLWVQAFDGIAWSAWKEFHILV